MIEAQTLYRPVGLLSPLTFHVSEFSAVDTSDDTFWTSGKEAELQHRLRVIHAAATIITKGAVAADIGQENITGGVADELNALQAGEPQPGDRYYWASLQPLEPDLQNAWGFAHVAADSPKRTLQIHALRVANMGTVPGLQLGPPAVASEINRVVALGRPIALALLHHALQAAGRRDRTVIVSAQQNHGEALQDLGFVPHNRVLTPLLLENELMVNYSGSIADTKARLVEQAPWLAQGVPQSQRP